MKIKVTNKILIPALCILLLLFAFLWFITKNDKGDYKDSCVYIKEASKVTEKIDISTLGMEEYEIKLKANTVCVTSLGVYMKEASCPDKLCMHSGIINKPGQSIVCLPNKIMVEIISDKKDVDAVAGAR